MIKSILIANRSEIAIRIAKTARQMGIKTYMFLTHQEPNALYLNYADELIDVSSNTFTNVFMDIELIIERAKAHQIDAIHPGYGFLSENPAFAKECKRNSIVYIGPSAEVIDKMGNKGIARNMAQQAGVPILKGSEGIVARVEQALDIARGIGFPVIIKAVAGGGGKGMRVAETEEDLPKMFKMAINEAKSVFGNGAVFIEKYVVQPRHIEVQVVADTYGNMIHLFDRECSIQRKHQKLLEEAPSPLLSMENRQKLGTDALALCKAVGYYSVGTVEFLVDADGKHYFMEMNTRIQVEHPVTEIITGVDIVEQQIRIAQGESLTLMQEDIKIKSHAIEFRINAEDVQADFAPCNGIIEEIEFPDHPNLRVDSGYKTDKVVPACFDSLIAKAIVYADTREEVVELSKDILKQIKIKGIKSTIPFFRQVLETASFVHGTYSTSFVAEDLSQLNHQEEDEYMAASAAALKAYLTERSSIEGGDMQQGQVNSWQLNHLIKS